jgi:hypothetical protein
MTHHLFGIDVSHHQVPAALKWHEMHAAGCAFAIVRLTYGTMRDRAAPEHIERARAAGMVIGTYLFFRPDQPVQAQYDAFREAALVAGYGMRDDIVPSLDIEDDTAKRPIGPADAPRAAELATKLHVGYGVPCMVYITQRDWGRVGSPSWVLRHPLWVAHYAAPSRAQPATPDGRPWAIWQHRVGQFDPSGANGFYREDWPQIDQNRANYLPLLSGEPKRAPLDPLDVLGAERHIGDPDRTHEKRTRILESQLRVEAQYHATESTFALSEAERRAGIREAAGLEPERHDTEPSPPPTEPPPEGEA